MGEEKKNVARAPIEIQIPEKKEENAAKGASNHEADSSDFMTDMPTVTTLLQRKKLTIVPSQTPKIEVNNIAEVMDSGPQIIPSQRRGGRSVVGKQGAPPLFRKKLILEETLNIKRLKSALSSHEKSSNMKKLDCLSYFANRFQDITYFEATPSGSLKGVLGYGLEKLILEIREKTLLPNALPSIFGLLAQGEAFVGPVESLRTEDHTGLKNLGFQKLQFVGVFPITDGKTVIGVWLCTSSLVQDIPVDEVKTLKKFFSGLKL